MLTLQNGGYNKTYALLFKREQNVRFNKTCINEVRMVSFCVNGEMKTEWYV